MRLMLESIRLRLIVIPFAAAALTVACGEGQMLQSPTGPSGTIGSTTPLISDDADGATTASSTGDFGTLAKGGIPGGNGKGENKKPEDSDEDGPGHGKKPEGAGNPGRGHQYKLVGFVSAKSGDELTVNGVTVTAGTDAIIRHGHLLLTIADIQVGDHIQARGERDGTKLVATEIKVQDTDNDDKDDDEEDEEDDETELKGAISSLTGTCPAVTFMIGSTKFTTSNATKFEGVTCETLSGKTVEVEWKKQADGSNLARKIELD